MQSHLVMRSWIYIADFAAFNAVYAEFFKENPPARSCVGGIDLPKGALCEIEVIAQVK